MKKIISIVFVACIFVMMSSCGQEELVLQESQVSAVETQLNGGPSKVSSSNWGSFLSLPSTGNVSRYFGVGTYAVLLKQSLLDPSTVTMTLNVQNQTNSSTCYVCAYKNDANNNQLYYSGWKTVTAPDMLYPLPNISITGSQSIVYVLKISTPGYYIFWYRRI